MTTTTRREFGQTRRLPSGRWQARWRLNGTWYTARRVDDQNRDLGPRTFNTRKQAENHLAWVRAEIDTGRWKPPRPASGSDDDTILLAEYAELWLEQRDLKPRTRDQYRYLLDRHILPHLGKHRLGDITPTTIDKWYAALGKTTGPTARAHAYGLLRTILGTAVTRDLLTANPCRIRGGGTAKRVKKIRPATVEELAAIVDAMPQPRYKVMVLIAAWCGLRFGELTELRRKDVDVKNGVLRVRRAVVHTRDGRVVVGDPKSDAGIRDVAIPPHLLPTVRDHVRGMPPEALLFPARTGGHMQLSSLYKVFRRARAAAGRPDLRWHDLRHTGAVLAAATGATLAELMARLGHSTPSAAMRYQHAAAERDRVIADALSRLAEGVVVPITDAPSRRSKGGEATTDTASGTGT